MTTKWYRLPIIVAVAAPLVLGACVTQSEVDALRAELERAKADAAEANRRASAAEAAARKAEERADRIYRESLRK